MNILVINCGSSSLKYQLLDMETENVLAIGLTERIGIEGSRVKHETVGKEKVVIEQPMESHKEAIQLVLDTLVNPEYGAIASLEEIDAVGHRVVHGGEKFAGSEVITEEVIAAMEECIDLAPLHNPPNIIGIRACQELMPGVPMVGVFDTAFHQTMPAYSYIYPLPYELYEELGVRKYGFHGTSHKYVSLKAAEMMNQDIKDLKIITCHLGNGASVTAIKDGKSLDTSMGLTPLEGLAMGTRSGNIDPAIVTFLMDKKNLSIDEVNHIINKESGVLGISGVSSDFRDIEEAAEAGNERAQLALDIFHYLVKKFIGSYAAAMGGVDVLVFTAGLGENSVSSREEICKGLEFMGIEIDPERNNVRGKETLISKDGAKVKTFVIPTNEELMIARDTKSLVSKNLIK
ncbi:acetate kinase [Dethiosulfatibacter aminovorans DSM 17477]|uniref:Acetate kinase n=1 Tax=Dethiosulfatibacter aminovorans DSM 17477 TaxID=1121476 RepID=A0A1M6DHC7_9FIRM|nr:acetate kinase [Dethiosulfatibacter aminovorans]SHI72541.1 acetate kinase [Dethiosulfatibacter aminovorans DSM 17477]